MESEYTANNIRRENSESLLSPADRPEPERVQLDTLTRLEIIGYSLGHFQNDLCAACWFNYLLYFMKNVVFKGDADSGFYAGIVLLSGQIADGVATPLVGIFSDRTNTRIGKRTPWYIFGFVLVTVCFVFIFQECLFCQWFDSDSKALRIFYYTFFPAAFNVGWAAVQVAHMSLVPSLTLSRRTRDRLNNARNTFTYIANLYVLLFAFLVFLVLDCDFEQFKVLSLGSLALGVATSFFFLYTVREAKLVAACKNLQRQLKSKLKCTIDSKNSISDEKPTRKTCEEQLPISPVYDSNGGVTSDLEKWELSDDENGQVHMSSNLKKKKKNAQAINSNAEEVVSWTHWFKLPSFYLYGFVYMGARLLVNVQSSLIIFYLQNVLGISQGTDTFDHGLPIEFAIIPMIIYLSSSISSSVLKIVYQKIGRRRAFAIGSIAALIGTGAMQFLGPDTKFLMYPLTIIIGVGQSVILNTSISLIAEVVGGKGGSGAFVFGAYSLLDKFANGIALYAVMNIKDVSDIKNVDYLRHCATIIPAVSVIGAWILVLIGKATDYDAGDAVVDNEDKKNNHSTDEIN